MTNNKDIECLINHYKDMLTLKKKELAELTDKSNNMLPIDKSLEASKISGQSQYIKFFIEDLEKLLK